MELLIRLPSSPAPRVSIIIVAARQPLLLARCLESIASCATATPFETIVVLNDAIPDVRTLVCERVSGVTVVPSMTPLGLAGGLNRGRAEASGEFLALFHDDSEAQPGWLDALVAAADAHPEAGAFGSRMLHSDGTPQASGSVLWRDATPRALGTKADDPSADETAAAAVDYCGTACLLVRAATWDAIGGADERFYPAYYVDVDLCLSIWSLNHAVLRVPASRVRHRKGASTELPFRRFISRRNRERFQKKWGSRLDILEPPPPREDWAKGVQRALERARARWRQAHPVPMRTASDIRPRSPLDADAQALRALRMALDLERAWTAELNARTTELTAELQRFRSRSLTWRAARALSRSAAIYRRLRSTIAGFRQRIFPAADKPTSDPMATSRAPDRS